MQVSQVSPTLLPQAASSQFCVHHNPHSNMHLCILLLSEEDTKIRRAKI